MTPNLQPIPAGSRESRCRSCKAPIYWIRTAAGRPMPVSVVDGEDGHQPPSQDSDGYGISHFANCPHANSHRKGGTP